MNSKFRDKIDSFHQNLNHRDSVPERCYRRNNMHYRLVCYVNNIIALYLSSYFDAIPIFINRAFKELIFLKKILKENKRKIPPYYNFVLEYLKLMAQFSNSLESIEDNLKSRIPIELFQKEIDIEKL
jgi:hypothetical protein